MRAGIVLGLLGLFIGILGTVMTLGALRQGTPFHQGLMSVMAHHTAQLRGMADHETCDPSAIERHLRMLRLTGDDLESAFLPTLNDERFRHYANRYRKALDDALASPPTSCPDASAMAASIGDSCSSCHRDFR